MDAEKVKKKLLNNFENYNVHFSESEPEMKLILDKEEDEYESYYYDYDADGEQSTDQFYSGFIIHCSLEET